MLQRRVAASWWCERHIHTSVLAAWRQSAGESDPIKKNPEEDPWVRSGTQVSQGWAFGGQCGAELQAAHWFVPWLRVRMAAVCADGVVGCRTRCG